MEIRFDPLAKQVFEVKGLSRNSRMDDFEEARRYFLKGLEYQQMKSLAEAESMYVRSLELLPDRPSTLLNLSLVQFEQGKIQQARKTAERTILVDPDSAAALTLTGAIYLKLELYDFAISKLERAISLDPSHYEAYNVYGNALKELNRFDEALACYERAVAANPKNPEAYNNSGNILNELSRFDEALARFDKAIALRPDYVGAYSNRGNILRELNRIDEALASYDRAIALNPDYADAHHGRSHPLLLRGDFFNGFREYEWRKRIGRAASVRSYAKPLWTGKEYIAGKTILIHHEQGLGDTIQFSRYIRLLESRGANVLFAPQAQLQRLLSGIGDRCMIVRVDDASLDFAFHSPLLSLPLALNTTLNTIPDGVPYIKAEARRIKHWNSRLGGQGFKIGICWQGSKNKVDRGRSFSVNEFYGLSQIRGVRLISLHKGDGEIQLESLPSGMVVERLGAGFDAGEQAFLDTAAVMKCCDLIITSDTAIAHLGGALAIPTWVALKYVPDWRWLLNRDDSPWYPTVKLFRQKQQNDWGSVFDEIGKSLLEKMSS